MTADYAGGALRGVKGRALQGGPRCAVMAGVDRVSVANLLCGGEKFESLGP